MRGATLQPAAGVRHAFRPAAAAPPRRALLGGLVAAAAGVGLSLLAGMLLPPDALSSAPRAAVASGTELPLTPVNSSGGAVRLTQPRAVTLQPSDLPPGTRLASEGPASFRSGSAGTPPPSWDVLLQLDSAQAPDYRYVESLAVIYPSERSAASAMNSMGSDERRAGASQKAPSDPVGGPETIWMELSASQPSQVIVRVTWQSMNVVGQVSVFASTGEAGMERAQQLAQVEENRIADPVAFRDAG